MNLISKGSAGRRRGKESMSYCVNCGVELDQSAKSCPLCNTPVINPKELAIQKEAAPFPEEKGQVEAVNRKDFGILLSTVVLATAVTCGLLNAFIFKDTLWSLAVIGVCVILWVMLIPVVIYTRQSVYLSLLLDGAAVLVYLYMLAYMIRRYEWFYGLGMPIVLWVILLAECFALCLKKLPRSFLTVALYIFTALGLLCMGLEVLIDFYLYQELILQWSAIVATVCAIVDIAVITLLSRRRLRNEVRRRLHF